MLVYTVTKPVGTKDREFEAYTRLLEDVGIDVANSPRVPEPGSDRRWLYAWTREIEAERFASELRRRTRDSSWIVHSFENASADHGPVAPLDVALALDWEGYTYYLTPASRERVRAAYPGQSFPVSMTISVAHQPGFLANQRDASWMELARYLTGRTDAEIEALGGIRIMLDEDTIVFQSPSSAARSPH